MGTPRRRPSVDPAAVGYLLLTVVAVAQVVVGRASADDVVAFALPAAVLVVAWWWGAAGRPAAPGLAVRALAVAAAVLAAWAVVAFVIALPSADGADGFYDVKVQVTTSVADHNVLASLLLVGLVAAAWLRGPAGWLALAVVTLGLGATLSRGAAIVAVVVAMVVAAGAWLLPAVPRTRNSTVPPLHVGRSVELRRVAGRLAVGAIGALGLVLLAAWLLGAAVPEGDGPTSVASRGQLWRAGVTAIAEEPLVGVGLDGFSEVASREMVADPRDHVHSLPLHAAATVGVPAAVLYLGLWVLLAVRGWRHPDPRVRALALLGGGALFLHGLIDETAFRLPVELTLAVLLAVSAPVSTSAATGRGGAHNLDAPSEP